MINERANNPQFPNNRVYKKNKQLHGQTLRITRQSIPKKLQSNTVNKNNYQFNNKSSQQNIISNNNAKNILTEKRYLKKSVNKKMPTELKKNKIISSFNFNTNNFNFSKQNNILTVFYICLLLIFLFAR